MNRITLVYEDENEFIELGKILTNHSMTTEEALDILDIDLEKWAKDQEWDNVDYECLDLRYL